MPFQYQTGSTSILPKMESFDSLIYSQVMAQGSSSNWLMVSTNTLKVASACGSAQLQKQITSLWDLAPLPQAPPCYLIFLCRCFCQRSYRKILSSAAYLVSPLGPLQEATQQLTSQLLVNARDLKCLAFLTLVNYLGISSAVFRFYSRVCASLLASDWLAVWNIYSGLRLANMCFSWSSCVESISFLRQLSANAQEFSAWVSLPVYPGIYKIKPVAIDTAQSMGFYTMSLLSQFWYPFNNVFRLSPSSNFIWLMNSPTSAIPLSAVPSRQETLNMAQGYLVSVQQLYDSERPLLHKANSLDNSLQLFVWVEIPLFTQQLQISTTLRESIGRFYPSLNSTLV